MGSRGDGYFTAEDAEGEALFPLKEEIASVGRRPASGSPPLPRNDKQARPAPAFRLSLRAQRSGAKQSPASTGEAPFPLKEEIASGATPPRNDMSVRHLRTG